MKITKNTRSIPITDSLLEEYGILNHTLLLIETERDYCNIYEGKVDLKIPKSFPYSKVKRMMKYFLEQYHIKVKVEFI